MNRVPAVCAIFVALAVALAEAGRVAAKGRNPTELALVFAAAFFGLIVFLCDIAPTE